MLYEEIRIKQGFSYILFCPLRILYNSKFIIMATFLGTNAVVVMRVHCNNSKSSIGISVDRDKMGQFILYIVVYTIQY